MAVDPVFGKINVLGLGSGLDLQGLLDKLRELREEPIEELRAKKDLYEKTLTEYDYINTKLLDLKSKVLDLSLTSTYLARKAEVSGDAVSVTVEAGALRGTYSVEVTKLAEKSVWQSQGFASDTDVITPTADDVLSIQVGDESFSVLVPQNTTLRGLVDLINESSDNPGVTASIVNTGEPGTPYRLVLTSDTTGEGGRIMVTQHLQNVSFSELVGPAEAWKTANYANPTDVVNSTGSTVTLTITVGSKVVTVSVADGTTLEELDDLINQEAENAGLSDYLRAYLVRDSSGNYYVEVRSPFDLTVSDDWAGGDLFPTQISATGETLNAILDVDGVTYYRESNEVNDIVPGVTFNLIKTGTATVVVQEDYEGIKELLKEFVEGVNELLDYIEEKSGVDPETGEVGPLYGSDVAEQLKNDLRSALIEVVEGLDGPSSLFDLGLEISRDGTITLDEEKLSEVLEENPEGVAKLLAGDEDAGIEGLASKLNDLIGDYIGAGGLLDIAQDATERRIELVEKEIEREEASVEKYMEAITRQFIALDSYLQELNALSTYLDTQFQSLSALRQKK